MSYRMVKFMRILIRVGTLLVLVLDRYSDWCFIKAFVSFLSFLSSRTV